MYYSKVSSHLILFTLVFLILIASCSGGHDTGIVSPIDLKSSGETERTSGQSRVLWAFYRVVADTMAGTIEATPVRDAQEHMNVLTFLERGPCLDCVRVTGMELTNRGTFIVNVELQHPVPDAYWTGFDVRGICMFTGTHLFPASGLRMSDGSLGQGEMVNPDGYTALYNYTTAGAGSGGIQGYQKGKMASPVSPKATLNPFKRHISLNTANTRNAFYAGDKVTNTYELRLPAGQFEFGYAVDAEWVPPLDESVDDPMSDFPDYANCPEPWRLDVGIEPVNWGMTSAGGQCKLKIQVFDRGGHLSHKTPLVECSELWNGAISALWVEDGTGQDEYSYYEITVQNSKQAPEGRYKCLVKAEDALNGPAPYWLDLTMYQVVELNVENWPPENHELWYFTGETLASSSGLADAIQVLNQAAAAGYTKVVLGDYALGVLDMKSPLYFYRLNEFRKAAERAGIEIIPLLVPIGYSTSVMNHDPNLIEGQPVYNCGFTVNGNTADVVQDPTTFIYNNGFEWFTGSTFLGWEAPDAPGAVTAQDTVVKHSGNQSVRFENFTANIDGFNRIRHLVNVKPWQCYVIPLWVKTQNLVPAEYMAVKVYSPDTNELLSAQTFNLAQTQDWTHVYAVFNSQDYTSAWIYVGIWGGKTGCFWVDDMAIEKTGLINVIRRSGTPLVVTNSDGSVEYQEGVDFNEVSDPRLGNDGAGTFIYDLYHQRPVITLTPGSKIQNGQSLLVDYYHATFVNYLQAACCLTDEAVYDIFETTLTKVNEAMRPREVMFHIDELRVANWCTLCQSQGKTPGQLLADATERVAEIAHSINPTWNIITWSDMYDPNHNAHDNYWLCNGTMENSWVGLPAEWDIANWLEKSNNTMSFFDNHRNWQILCGFYDVPGPNYTIDDWLDLSKTHTGIYAVMYTTWHDNYSELQAWADTVRQWDATNW